MTTPPKTPPLRLGILLSGSGTTLQNLADCIARQEIPATIAVVISSNPAAYGLTRAQNLHLPTHSIPRKSHPTLQSFSDAISQTLRDHQVNLVCMAGFLSLWQIPPDFQNRVLNIHPALLPKFGGKGMHGLRVHEAVIAAAKAAGGGKIAEVGAKEAMEGGCTVHFADNQYDHGPILLQSRCPVLPTDTPESLAARVFAEECKAYPEAIRWFAEDVIVLRPDHTAVIKKVLAYITREHQGKTQLLVFNHTHAPRGEEGDGGGGGTQVPAGTVERNEDPDHAVLREAHEETGIPNLRIIKKIATVDWLSPIPWGVRHERHIYHLATRPSAPPLPDTWQWTETAGGTLPPEKHIPFTFHWLNLTDVTELANDHHLYLHLLIG